MADEKNIAFVVRVFEGSHESHASALAHVDRVCQQAARDCRAAGGARQHGVVLADGGTIEIGSWEYTNEV
jgi:hypothetical protein